jgi:hypothetical protein
MCPPCAWLQVERWLMRQQARLLACEHDHALFTVPHALNDLWLANIDVRTGLLCARVHDTLVALLGDATYLGARSGIMATRHTGSQTLLLHPHLHCVVTGGGLAEGGHWVAVSHGFLLPRRVGMALFRGKWLAARGLSHIPRLTTMVCSISSRFGRWLEAWGSITADVPMSSIAWAT